MSLPITINALVSNGDKTAAIKQVPLVQSPGPNEILVRVRTIGLNPTDWKTLQTAPPKDNILGCDSAGEVVAVGPGVTRFKPGDHVSSFVYGAASKDNGAFAEYVRFDAETSFALPKNMSYNEGASLPIPHATAAQGLYAHLNFPFPTRASPSDEILLIWGGSTAVGHHAIQLARLSGFRVFVTASKKAHDHLKELGAERCFDYHDKDVVEQIKAAAGEPGIRYGFDTVSEGGTGNKVVDIIGPQGGKVVILLRQEGLEERRADVKVTFILLYAIYADHPAYGVKFQPHDRKVVSEYVQDEFPRIVEGWVEGKGSSKLKPQSVRVVEGGLNGAMDGMEIMRRGQYGREKLVCPVV